MWVRWQDGKPAEHIVRRPGERLPERDSLGFTDESQWETGPSGEPKDPWANTRLVYLVDENTAEAFTFSTSSWGGRDAVIALGDTIARMRAVHPEATPIIELRAVEMPTRFGKKSKPSFKIVGWKNTSTRAEPTKPVDRPKGSITFYVRQNRAISADAAADRNVRRPRRVDGHPVLRCAEEGPRLTKAAGPGRRAMLNDDEISVKGCTLIYAPAGQAGEYAPLAANPYRGCGHKCAYCYVPSVIHITRSEFDAGAVPKEDYLARLEADARKYQAHGVTEQVLLSFTTDVYNPVDTSLTRPCLEIVQEYGLGFCVLTKGGSRALRDIDLYRPDRDAFASTLTSLDLGFSRKWERAAADPDDRIATLRGFHTRGIFTWVSLEPVLNVEASLAIVDATHEFVDLYKIGRINYSGLTKTIDWREYTLRMIDKLQHYDATHYVKHDLQPFLPSGYFNPLRVRQHRAAAP